ncbi:hypothetical protein M6B38_106895 [Iris pallida]|uniref:Secreted protein n=1 Tax=Iris pallida TaxID=29817 RepID=A0AAX6EIR3_IRIPA|nr:hypothetical protein M6B38_187575 [Iris pallida]KAJ6807026.1 hypothetical protein M6B38_106895 [Iris pallida]
MHFSLYCLELLVGVVLCSFPDRIRCWYLEDMVPPWVRAQKWWSFYFRMDLDYRVIVRLFPRFV